MAPSAPGGPPIQTEREARRSRLLGRLFVTTVLLVAVLGGLVVLHFGKGLAAKRTARFANPGAATTTAPPTATTTAPAAPETR